MPKGRCLVRAPSKKTRRKVKKRAKKIYRGFFG